MNNTEITIPGIVEKIREDARFYRAAREINVHNAAIVHGCFLDDMLAGIADGIEKAWRLHTGRPLGIADIPKVLIRDTRTDRIVGEGYYFEYEAYMPYPIYDGEPPPPPPTVRCVVVAEPNDFGLAPNVRILRVTPPHEIVVKPTPAERTNP